MLGGVFVRELVDHVSPLAVGVIDLHEVVPLLRQGVLGEIRFARTLWFAGTAVARVDAAGGGERVLLRPGRAEGFGVLPGCLLDVHYPPEDLAGRQVQPSDRTGSNTKIRLHARLLARADGDEPRVRRCRLQPGERLVICRPKAPRPCFDDVPVCGKPSVDEAGDVFHVPGFRERAFQVHRSPDDAGARIAWVDVEARRKVDLVEEILELRDLLAIELDVMEMLARANLLLVPAAVPEDEAVQYTEPIGLGVADRRHAGRRNELARGKRVASVAVGKRPRVGWGRPDRPPELRDVPRRQTRAAMPRSFLEGWGQLELDERLAAEPFHDSGSEAVVGQHSARLTFELREGADALARQELLGGRETIDALLRVNDQDPLELVDTVDRADIDAGEVFDVDAWLADDVGHWPLSVLRRLAPRRGPWRALSARISPPPGRNRPRERGAVPSCRCGS